ncbi:MAG: thiol reductase thioredoxin [Ruminococcaceae bacterium]|nr:thiol reductase thioredoxin [Oscillospiraceae bacterium]
MVEQLNAERLRQLQNMPDRMMAVELYTDWCPSCKSFERIFEAVAAEWSEQGRNVTFGKLNLDEADGVAKEYGVRSVPTVLVLCGGEVLDRRTGLLGKAPLTEWLCACMEKIDRK